MMKKPGETAAILTGLLVASWVLVVLVLAAELVPEVGSFLKMVFGNGWVAKVAISYVLFFLVWAVARLKLKKSEFVSFSLWKWVAAVSLVLEMVIISVLYLLLYLTA